MLRKRKQSSSFNIVYLMDNMDEKMNKSRIHFKSKTEIFNDQQKQLQPQPPSQQPSQTTLISYEIHMNRKATPWPTKTRQMVRKTNRSPLDGTLTAIRPPMLNRDHDHIPRMCDRFERIIQTNCTKFIQNIQCWTNEYQRHNLADMEKLSENFRAISEKIDRIKNRKG